MLRLSLFFFLLGISQVFAVSGYSQEIRLSFNYNQSRLVDILEEIENQTEYFFLYNEDFVDVQQLITLQVKGKKIEQILEELFRSREINYTIHDRQIVLSSNSKQTQTQQTVKTVKGKISDSSGQVLPGVSIVIKGTTIGTITDFDGNFILADVPSDAILIFSFVGMKRQEVSVNGHEYFEITMDEDAIGIDEVVAIGYGTQKKVNLTGAVSSVKSEELVKVPAANVSELLSGRTPGLLTKQTTGVPGNDATSLSIRGFGSPLVLVDGIEMSFNRLDPNDIESINVLKDAAAAIYGARAGNGVILVTTKRGTSDQPVVSYHGNISFQEPTVLPNFVDSWQFAELMREGQLNGDLPTTFSEEDIEKYKQGTDANYPNQDWYDALFVKWAQMQQHNVSLRGGSERIKFFTSVGFLDQASLFTSGDWDFKRYNARANIDAEITKNLSMAFDLSYRMEQRDEPNTTIGTVWNQLQTAQPIWPANLPDSSLGGAYSGFSERSPVANTFSDLSGYRDDRREIFTGQISLNYKVPFVKGLSAKLAFNYNSNNTYKKTIDKPFDVYSYDYELKEYTKRGVNGQNKLDEEFSKFKQLYPLISFEYDRTFGDHSVKGLLLAESIDTEYLYVTAARLDLLSLDIPYLFAGSQTNMTNNGNARETGRTSYVGRLNYDFKGKYLFEGSFRYDASHRFPKDSRWGFFPSISAGWRISEESFMQNLNWLDNFKLRGSYSQSGNDYVDDDNNGVNDLDQFRYLTGYTIRRGLKDGYLIGDELGRIITTTGLPNPNLTWLEMTNYNIGFDAGFLDGLIGIEFDYFYRKTDGIFGKPLDAYPSTFGAELPRLNINSTSDRGFELVINHRNKIRDLSYTVAANVGLARGKYEQWAENDYDDPDEIRIYQKEGNWTNRWIGYKSDGIFMTQEEIDNHPINQDQNGNTSLRPGDIKYIDLNDDKVIDWKDQDEIGYGTFPDLNYGLNLGLEYKGWALSALFQGAGMFNWNVAGTARAGFSNWSIPFDYHYKYRWQPDPTDLTTNINPKAQLPAIDGSGQGTTGNNDKTSDFWLQDNTYLRLKNLNISYTLPQRWVKHTGMKNIKAYASGSNLFTWSKLGIYKNSWDPESSFTYPPVKTITLGIQVSL